MSEWTPRPRKIKTPNGVITYGGACRDHYKNFQVLDQGGGHTVLVLQGPAMRAFKEAKRRFAKRSGWSAERLDRNPEGRVIEVLPGTNRSCETQRALFASDPDRFADPKITGHTRGLAIDVSQAQGRIGDIDASLRAAGWVQARPDDEPWHWSYGVTI